MGITLETVLAKAMQLSEDDREMLAVHLFSSLPRDPAVDAAWEAECERRIREVDSGAVQWLAGDQVMAELKAKYPAR
jgi:putative addiction module component (TIGR02574 family)